MRISTLAESPFACGRLKIQIFHYFFFFSASLVPVFSFGENDMYAQPFNRRGSYLRAIQDCVRRWLAFAPVFFYGRGIFQNIFGFMPYRSKIATVGKDFKLSRHRKNEIDYCSLPQIAGNHLHKLKNIFIFCSDR